MIFSSKKWKMKIYKKKMKINKKIKLMMSWKKMIIEKKINPKIIN